MELPNAQHRQKYIEAVKSLEYEIKRATDNDNLSDVALHLAQEQLDLLADKYQNDEKIGSATYKLYEMQALVYYFENKDGEALDFINQAIETKGGSYPKAEKLKDALSSAPKDKQSRQLDESRMTKADRRKDFIGLEGWLALFVVGVGLSILLGVINLADYGSAFSNFASLQNDMPDYVAAMTPALWFEMITNILVIVLAVWLLVLLARRSKLAKDVAIIYLLLGALFLIIDYAWASWIFDTHNVTQYVQPEMNRAANDVGRSIIGALIWVPYFLVSKRVKATLIK